jgi:hypothetical protein
MKALENDMFLGKDGVRTLFRIDNCTRAVDIQAFSAYASEAEVLLIPGAYLEVVDVGDMGHGLVIISLKQISPPAEMFDLDMDPAERAEEEVQTLADEPNMAQSKAPKGPFPR